MLPTETKACEDIESGILKIQLALDLLEQLENFKSLTVQELRWLKEYKATMFIQAGRLETLLQTVFTQEK